MGGVMTGGAGLKFFTKLVTVVGKSRNLFP